jgi:threonine dehydratase
MGVEPVVSIDRIREAARRLAGVAMRTPLIPLQEDPPVLLKAESLQPVGSFKLRGAYNAIARLPRSAVASGVITASSGNHAQGVARAARLLGVPATIVMPTDAPTVKRRRVEADGATIVDWDPTSSRWLQDVADDLARERRLPMIHPFEDPDVMAGQGTIGLEIAEELPEVECVVIPIGGGGLISGIATAIRALRPRARIVGVEPALAADAQASLRAGRLIEWPAAEMRRTIADGTRVNITTTTFAHISALVDDIVAVAEDEIIDAMRRIATGARLVAEPSGALAVAAITHHAAEIGLSRSGPVVGVLSGGNVDPERYVVFLSGVDLK